MFALLLQASSLADYQANQIGGQLPGGASQIMAGGMVAVVIFSLIMLALAVINLINLYHWGLVDRGELERAGEPKKKWFVNLLIIPTAAGLVMIIPILGWIVGAVAYIYWMVMTLIYFFKIRKKVPLA